MKVICVDNFARENRADSLVCEGVSDFFGKAIVTALNERLGGEQSEMFFKLVPDDHKLWRGMEELV